MLGTQRAHLQHPLMLGHRSTTSPCLSGPREQAWWAAAGAHSALTTPGCAAPYMPPVPQQLLFLCQLSRVLRELALALSPGMLPPKALPRLHTPPHARHLHPADSDWPPACLSLGLHSGGRVHFFCLARRESVAGEQGLSLQVAAPHPEERPSICSQELLLPAPQGPSQPEETLRAAPLSPALFPFSCPFSGLSSRV